MKKVFSKKVFAIALFAVMGFMSLVAMKPMYKNFPALGIMTPPPVIDPLVTPDEIVVTVINNSGCPTLSFDLGFKAQQNGGELTNEAVFENSSAATITYKASMFNGFFGSQINYNQPFSIVEGGIDINIGTETKLNLKPGQSLHWDDGSGSTDPCKCFNAVWNEATKTITISRC